MARIRSVKPSLFGSYSLAKVSIEARFLFIGLFCEADDDGRLIDSPKRIAGAIFPHDEKVSEAKVKKWLDDLEEIGSLVRYESADGRYIALPEWPSHQKISHPVPSALPNPPGTIPERLRKVAGSGPEPLRPEEELNGNGNTPIGERTHVDLKAASL